MPDHPTEVFVHLDAVELGPRRLVGTLRRAGSGRRSAISFAYASEYLAAPDAFAIDPYLRLHAGDQYIRDGTLPAIFSDAAPDRWGRALMERREAHLARREGRPTRTLDDWDFLLGVSDAVRMGALRIARPDDGHFIDDGPLDVPPMTRLRTLQHAANEFERPSGQAGHEALNWLELLFAPGSSLGGARPKSNVVEEDGTVWIAKFPSRADRHDVGAWESVLATLASRAGITVADHRLLDLGSEYRTFTTRRFDRKVAGRRAYASAMTLAGKRDGEPASYLDIALAVADHVQADAIEVDLDQLFRRLVFNVLAANRDDHLRNHGFLRSLGGWRLAPAFDVNPSPGSPEHTLAIDETVRTPDLDLALETAPFYRLPPGRADAIVEEVRGAVAGWRQAAQAIRISATEIDLMAAAFAP